MARTLVCGLIHASVPRSARSVDCRWSTSASARDFAEGGNAAVTYAFPRTSRSAASVEVVQRCQRGSCSFTPSSTPLRNAKLASSKRLGSALAYASATWKRRYAFQTSSGVVASCSSYAVTNEGTERSIVSNGGGAD